MAGLLLVTGCDSFVGFGSDDDELDTANATTMEVDGLAVHLFAPDTVAVADSFSVRVIVQNQADEKWQTVTTPHSCLVQPGIFNGEGNRVSFRGSWRGCLAVITTHEFPPGDSKKIRFDMEAVVSAAEEEVPATPGLYTLKVDLRWTEDRSVERTLVVERSTN